MNLPCVHLIAILAIGVLACRSTEQQVTRQTAGSTTFQPSHAHGWIGTVEYHDPPTADEVQYQARLVARSHPAPALQPQNPSPELEAQLDHVISLIALAQTPQHAWEWPRLRELIMHLHQHVRLTVAATAGEGAEINLIYLPSSQTLTIPPILTRWPEDVIAGLLVHEATHILVEERSLAATGRDEHALSAIAANCHDVFLAEAFTTEALAYLNQIAWTARTDASADTFENWWATLPTPEGVDPATLPLARNMMLIAQAMQREPARYASGFRAFLNLYALNERISTYEAYGLDVSQLDRPQRECGPLITREGRRFYPSDFYPAYLEPLINSPLPH